MNGFCTEIMYLGLCTSSGGEVENCTGAEKSCTVYLV